MANVELSQSEYQALLDAQAEARQLKKEIAKTTELLENKTKAIDEERIKRKELSDKIAEYESNLANKDEEFNSFKEKYSNFDEIKEKAEKYEEMTLKQKEAFEKKLEKIKETLWEEVLEKHSKFIDNMSDDLKYEYLSELKWTMKKEDFKSIPNDKKEEKNAPKIDERFSELNKKKEKGELSPSEKIDFLTLMSKQESQAI